LTVEVEPVNPLLTYEDDTMAKPAKPLLLGMEAAFERTLDGDCPVPTEMVPPTAMDPEVMVPKEIKLGLFMYYVPK